MGNIRVESCCCFGLETGVIILGAFNLVVGILTAGNGGRYVGKDPLIGSDFILEGSKLNFCGSHLTYCGLKQKQKNH